METGEEQFGHTLVTSNTEVQEEQMKDIHAEYTRDTLIEASYSKIVQGNRSRMET